MRCAFPPYGSVPCLGAFGRTLREKNKMKRDTGVVLRYAAFDGVCVLRDRAARLTQPTLNASPYVQAVRG